MSNSMIQRGNIYSEQKSLIRYLLNIASVHYMKIEEYLNFPIRFSDHLGDVFNTAKIKQGSLYTIYNDGMR